MWSWTQLTNWEMEIKGKLYSRHLSRRQNVHSLHLTSKPNRHVCEKEGNSRYTLYKVQYSPENSIFSSSFRVLNFYRNRMFQCERKKSCSYMNEEMTFDKTIERDLKTLSWLHFVYADTLKSFMWCSRWLGEVLKELTLGKDLVIASCGFIWKS